jgi:hypothetical protein
VTFKDSGGTGTTGFANNHKVLLSALSSGSGGGGAGAGLSIDDSGDIQLGNDGAGVIDISDTDVFAEGIFVKSFDQITIDDFYRGDFNIQKTELNSGFEYQDGVFIGNTQFSQSTSTFYFSAEIEELLTTDTAQTYLIITSGGEVQNNKVIIGRSINNIDQKIEFSEPLGTSNIILLTDDLNSKGLEYPSDYSANWTDHSLITKKWVEDNFGGGAGAGLSIDGSGDIQFGKINALDNQVYVDLSEYGFSTTKRLLLTSDFSSYNGDTIGVYSAIYSYQIGQAAVYSSISVSIPEDTTVEKKASVSVYCDVDNNASNIDLRLAIDGEEKRFLIDELSMRITDEINSKGLEEADDYSANKTDNSYITPNWLKYQTGYNSAVPQYFTHDGAGNFEWVDI